MNEFEKTMRQILDENRGQMDAQLLLNATQLRLEEKAKNPVLDHNSWNPENMTDVECKHCHSKLCKAEVQINKNDWKIRHHYDCFGCFQRYHA